MQRLDFLKLIGAVSEKPEYAAVAFLLKSGYAGFGYYNAAVNEGFEDVCVFLNVRLIDLEQSAERRRPTIRDFSEFLEEVVSVDPDEEQDVPEKPEFGKPIPITAVPLGELAVVYPVAQIGALRRRSKEQGRSLPTFFDMSKSEILSLLRTRLW